MRYSDPVIRHFGQLVSQDNVGEMFSLKSCFFTTLKAGAIVIGALSGIPYIAPAIEFAGEYKVAGYLLGYGVSASLAAVTMWSLLDVVDFFQSNREAKHLLPIRERSYLSEVAYWTLIPAFGIGASFPVAYLILRYNSGQIFFAAISLGTDSITNTCSLNLFCEDIRANAPYYIGKRSIKNIERARWLLIRKLDIAVQVLPNLSSENLSEILGRVQSSNFDAKDFMMQLIQLSSSHLEIETRHRVCYDGAPKYIVKAISAVFPLAWAIFAMINSYKSFGQLFDNDILRWFISTITTFPYLFLELTLATVVFSSIFDIIIGCAYGTNHRPLAQTYYPKSFYSLTTFGLFTTSCAFGSRAKFVTGEISGGIGIGLAVIVCISTVSYKSAAMLDLIKLVFEKIGLQFGDPQLKLLCKIVANIRKFNSIIRDADRKILRKFFNELGDPELTQLLSENLSIEGSSQVLNNDETIDLEQAPSERPLLQVDSPLEAVVPYQSILVGNGIWGEVPQERPEIQTVERSTFCNIL